LPRSYLLPIVLMLAAFASLIWRQHATETSVALNRISAEALALVRGPLLVDRQRLRIDLPRPEIQTGISLPVIAPTAVDFPSTARTENAEKPAPVPLSAAIPQLPAPAAQPPVAASAPESAALPLPKKSVSPLHVVPPEYPQSAMSAGIEGEVALEYQVDASGNVAQIRVISAHPAGVFEAAAKAALRAWRFPAASGNEKHTQNFAFTLHGRNRTEEQCQAPTGSLICRHPGE
jgi:TonB family protein